VRPGLWSSACNRIITHSVSQLTASLEVLVSEVAPADVEAADEEGDGEEEDGDGLWVASPVNDWVHCVFQVEETEIVGEHVEESVPDHQFPVSLEQLDVREVDVDPGHDEWCCVQDGPVENCEVSLVVPRGWSWHGMDIVDDNWNQNDPEAEGDSQVQAVRSLEPSEGHHMPVLWVA